MTSRPANFPAKRVLISGGLATGGPQTHLIILCRVLRQAGAQVTVVAASTNWPSSSITELRQLGVRVLVSPFGFGTFRHLGKAFSFFSWPLILRRNFDILYCLGEGRMHLVARRFVRKGGLKIYHEIVECPVPGSVAAQVAAQMDLIVANSKSVGQRIAQLLPGMPIRVLPFFTAGAPMPAPHRRALGSNDTLHIAFLGRLVSHKRPEQLIESWPVWNASSPIGPARLDLYGAADNHETTNRLQSQISSLQQDDSIRLHGSYPLADLPKIFESTDLAVLPSLHEGLPLVLVEAMQRGVPVVATSAGGTAELGEDNPDVLITSGTDWASFAAGVNSMAQRLRVGDIDSARLHRWTESRYGYQRVARAWRELFLENAGSLRA